MSKLPLQCDPLECTCDAFASAAVHRGDAIARYRALHRDGDAAGVTIAPIVRRMEEHGTIKFVQRLDDSLETETVVLPYRGSTGRQRTTLCVSSQVGCAMGCTFCETAQMGLMRNLTTREIVQQWYAARHVLGYVIDNVVFMGMGEPLDNTDAVLQAIRVLTDHDGPAIAASRVTVSTVGRVEGIRRLAMFSQEHGRRKLRLAVSVNAPSDGVRSMIMPVNRAEPMRVLREAMAAWPSRVLIEYVLIPGVNDLAEHADELAAWIDDLDCMVNVIPYNPRRNSPWPAPDEAAVDQFLQRLLQAGVRARRRQTKGSGVFAACGQLGNERIRRRRWVDLGMPAEAAKRHLTVR